MFAYADSSGGVVGSTPIYMRFNSATAQTFSGNITHDSTGATKRRVGQWHRGDPTITTTGTLSAFSSVISVASTEQSYTVSGTYLAGNVTVTAPTGFQISTTSGSGFGSTLTLSPTNGTLASTTIYVRLYSATVGTYSGNITHASSGATTKNVAASGTVSLCGTINLVTSGDTRMRASQSSTNYGSETTVTMSPYSTSAQGGLFKWGVSSIPSDATVSAASLSFYVTESSARVFSLYDLKRAWVRALPHGPVTTEPTTGLRLGQPTHTSDRYIPTYGMPRSTLALPET